MVGHGDLDDVAHMARALALAERGRGRTSPNPMVGAVVVDAEGVIVGRGAHERAGGPHAEIVALADAGDACQRRDPLLHARAVLAYRPNGTVRAARGRSWHPPGGDSDRGPEPARERPWSRALAQPGRRRHW